MENPDQIAQQAVGMDRRLLEIGRLSQMAGIDSAILECGEPTVRLVVAAKAVVSQRFGRIVLDQPIIAAPPFSNTSSKESGIDPALGSSAQR